MAISLPGNDLIAIQQKTRRLTRTPSQDQLSDDALNDYINTFILYDFPNNIRLFSYRTTLTFYTQPNIDTYDTVTVPPNDPLYNFKNQYIAIHQPVYLAGVQGYFTQWRDEFYGWWPQTNNVAMTNLLGNGSAGPFTGTAAYWILQNSVIFSCNNTNGTAMNVVDYPQINGDGTISSIMGWLNIPGEPTTSSTYNLGTINYTTGAYTVNFPDNTQTGATLWITTQVYQPGKPVAMLYYDDKFIIRPVPDKAYAIEIEADIRPTALLAENAIPDLEQFWQYIAYGAAKKIFEDRLDTDSIEQILPEFKNQENMVLRRTLTEQANSRSETIYTQGKNYRFGWFGTGWPY